MRVQNTVPVAVLTLLTFINFTAAAEREIARCIDENGDLTYTDFLCVTNAQDKNSQLMNEQAVDKSIRSLKPEVTNADTIASTQLQSVTSQAIERCVERFDNYFKRKYPARSAVTSMEFDRITDQYMKGNNVSISVIGTIEYAQATEIKTSNIECTVQKFSEGNDWLVGFLEK
ncbi:MAG: hypothetical protein P8Y24_14300 [Gammaproteobacteria bacterium]